jgi:hypothetical protein
MLMWAADFADYLLWVREPLSSHFFSSSAWAQWRDLLFFAFLVPWERDRREGCDSFLLCLVEVFGLVSSGAFLKVCIFCSPTFLRRLILGSWTEIELSYQCPTTILSFAQIFGVCYQ